VVVVGLIDMLAVFEPVLHVYVLAPDAVNVVVWPAQIVFVPLTFIVGFEFTTTVTVVTVLEQPFVVPVTV
jgi:hypothetical protein